MTFQWTKKALLLVQKKRDGTPSQSDAAVSSSDGCDLGHPAEEPQTHQAGFHLPEEASSEQRAARPGGLILGQQHRMATAESDQIYKLIQRLIHFMDDNSGCEA